MKRHPNLITPHYFFDMLNGEAPLAEVDGKWGPARCVPYYSFWRRVALAWGVFTGKYDAFEWWYKH